MKSESTPLLQVDAGDMLLNRGAVNERERDQRELKADLLLAASKQLGVDALGIGDGDLAFGLDFLLEGAARHDLPYVTCNLAHATSGELLFPATRIVTKGELKIGITGVALDSQSFPKVRVLPSRDSVRAAVAELRAESVDLVVVLSHLGIDEDQMLAREVEGIDLIFGSHSRKFQTNPIIVGKTAVFQAGSRSKYIGEARFAFVEGGSGWSDVEGRRKSVRRADSIRSQLDRYDEQIAAATDDAARGRLERIRRLAQARLDEIVISPEDNGTGHAISCKQVPMGVALDEPGPIVDLVDAALAKLGDAAPPADRSREKKEYGDFVGATQCIGCHRAQYEDWKTTGHARAYRTLMEERRQFDLECWSCHVTGADKEGGPGGPKEVGPMRNVQCESCHGPGRAHVSKPKEVHLVMSPPESTCAECHTEEQTLDRFVYSEYLSRVDHR